MKVNPQRVTLSMADLNGWEPPTYSKHPPRSPGVHVSDLIRSIAVRTGVLKSETVKVGRRTETLTESIQPSTGAGPDPVLFALGLAWECWAAGLYPEMVWQPSEVKRDGISMSADGLTLDYEMSRQQGVRSVVEEFKATRKSAHVSGSPRPIEGEWMWLAQVKSYCLGWDTDQARLHVLYINGNYRFGEPDGAPQYVRYDLAFTQRELSDNWELLLREKARPEFGWASLEPGEVPF